jgi:hypothetical protein
MPDWVLAVNAARTGAGAEYEAIYYDQHIASVAPAGAQ